MIWVRRQGIRFVRRTFWLCCALTQAACVLPGVDVCHRWHFVLAVKIRYGKGMQNAPLTVELVPIASLKLDPKNARLHPTENLDAIKGSLETFGQREALVVRAADNTVIGGNGRLAAMQDMGWEQATVTYVDCTPEEATALGLALNRTADTAQWDADRLENLLAEVKDAGFAADAFGFAEDQVEALLQDARQAAESAAQAEVEHVPMVEPDDTEVPQPPAEPKTKPGDIYGLGEMWYCDSCKQWEPVT